MARTRHHGTRLDVEADGTTTLTVDELATIIARMEEPGPRGFARAIREARRVVRRARAMAGHDDRRAARVARRTVKGGA